MNNYRQYRPLLVFGVVVAALASGCGPKQETTSPHYTDMAEAVYASGNVYPTNEYKLMANADGYLVSQLAEEGDVVAAGQGIFRLDAQSQQIRTEAAERIYRQSAENYSENSPALREMAAQIRIVERKLANDEANFRRFENLSNENAATRMDFDRAKLALETTREELAARRSAYQRLRNQLYVDLQQTKSNYQLNATAGKDYLVKAYASGKIYEVYKEKGELVRRGEPLALLGDAASTYIRLAIDESDFAKVQVGQTVLLKIDIFPDKVFKGKIAKRYPKLNKMDQTFRVDATFDEGTPEAYYGLTVEANILTSSKNKALVVPKSYVFGGDSLWIMANDKPTKIRIKKGIETLDLVEVTQGVTDKTVLIKP